MESACPKRDFTITVVLKLAGIPLEGGKGLPIMQR